MASKINSLTTPLFTSSEKEEKVSASKAEAEQSVALIDQLPLDVLDLIFRYTTKNDRNEKTLCRLREVSGNWRDAIDTYHLRSNWGNLQKKIKTPSLRSLVDQIAFVDRFVSEVISSAICSQDPELNADAALSNRIELMGPSSFSRFSLLTQSLREKGAPIPHEHTVIGLEFSAYEKMQQRLDTSLETIWTRIQQQINFEGAPIPANAEAIRQWLNNPINADKIACITQLDLSGMKLEILPPEIGKFSRLTTLKLSRNQLTALPPEIGTLSLLTILNLDQNKLTTLPHEIGSLSQLTALDLSTNRLTTLPSEINKLSHLKELNLIENRFSTLPSEIGKLTQLTKLYLRFNQLTTFPPEIGNLSQLRELDASENRLTALPPETGNLFRLTFISFSGNRLTVLPPQIGRLYQLKYLNLSSNWVLRLPPEMGNLSQLEELDLFNNPLTTLPSEIFKLSRKISKANLRETLLIFILNPDFCGHDSVSTGSIYYSTQPFLDCSNYSCRTPLASLCQKIHLGYEGDLLRDAFEALSDEMQQQIRQAKMQQHIDQAKMRQYSGSRPWVSSPSSWSSSSQAEADLFADNPSFVLAVISVLRNKWRSLPQDQRDQVHTQVAILAGEPGRPNFRAHYEKNIIRLLDAMELVTQK